MENSSKRSVKPKEDFSGLVELMKYFSNEQKCAKYFAQKQWGGKPECPHCKHDKVYAFKDNKRYKCAKCRQLFNVKTGTIFEDSKISLRKWFVAIYLVTSHKKGISSYQLSKDIKVTQKTAWFMLHRIRFALQYGFDKPLGDVSGIVEIDETFVGGKYRNRHADKKVEKSTGRSFKDKVPVLGMLERGGKVRAIVVSQTKTKVLQPIVEKHIYPDIDVMTDEWWKHSTLNTNFNHMYINHSTRQYAIGDIHTNGIEAFWSHFKRSIIGIYHRTSRKHLQYYVNEAVFRHNTRNMSECQRTNEVLLNLNVRLTYKNLTKT